MSGVSDGGRVGLAALISDTWRDRSGGVRVRPAWVEQASHPRPSLDCAATPTRDTNFVVLDKRALPASSLGGGYERRKRGLSLGPRPFTSGARSARAPGRRTEPVLNNSGASAGYRFLIYSVPLRQSARGSAMAGPPAEQNTLFAWGNKWDSALTYVRSALAELARRPIPGPLEVSVLAFLFVSLCAICMGRRWAHQSQIRPD